MDTSFKSKKPDKIVPKKKHTHYHIKNFEKSVAAVIENKKVLVVLHKNVMYFLKP